jgi:predicted nuclease with RNAse H fold
LRSIFRTLKAHKVVFTNPTARVDIGAVERRQPMPLDIEVIRSAIEADDPARAALAALLAFHGLRHKSCAP